MAFDLPRRSFSKKILLAGFMPFFFKGSVSAKSDKQYVPDLTCYDADDEKYWDLVRMQFLLNNNRSYFNNAGLGPSPKKVIETVNNWTIKQESLCETLHNEIDAVRDKLAHFFNVKAKEIAITRNTTEGVNIVARGLNLKKGDEIILTNHEHPGNAIPWMALKKEIGVEIKVVELDLSGEKNLEHITQSISKKTKVLAIPHIPCTTGMILPIKEIITFCRSKNIISCIDGAQSAGLIEVDLKDLNPDFYATSGHKWLLGPKGTGILFVNENSINLLKSTFAGPYSVDDYDFERLDFKYIQEAKREEYGTRGTPISMGLGAGIDFINTIGQSNIVKRSFALSNYFKKELKKIPELEILSPMNPKYASPIITFRLKGAGYSDVFHHLLHQSKCRVRGIFESDLNAIRVSCAFYNSFNDVDKLIAGIKSFKKK